jgi:hypothetical protein
LLRHSLWRRKLASPLPLATQECFATPCGDAGVLRHCRWRRSLACRAAAGAAASCASPLPLATQAASPLPVATHRCLATPCGDASLEAEISSKSYWTSSQYHKSKHQAHNIIYHISKYQNTMLIVQRRSYPRRSYIIYQRRSYIKEDHISYIKEDHIKEDQAHNIIYHISKKIIYQIRAHDHIQTSCS